MQRRRCTDEHGNDTVTLETGLALTRASAAGDQDGPPGITRGIDKSHSTRAPGAFDCAATYCAIPREHLDTVEGAFRAPASTLVIDADAESRTTETPAIAGEGGE